MVLSTESSADGSPGVEECDGDPFTLARSNSDSRLLNLPAELRLHIWQICSTWLSKPFIRWAADFGGIESSVEVDGGWIFTCKQVCEEALPVLATNVQLHITYLGHTPMQPTMQPQRSLCQRIESLFFHCSDGMSSFDVDRPPKQSVPFRRYPNLKTFTVCKPILVSISRLTAADGVSSLSPARYVMLSEEEKLTAWKTTGLISADALINFVARFGRGGWLCRIVDPGDHAAQAHDPDDTVSEDEDDESAEEYHSTDDETLEGEDLEKRRDGPEAKDLKVIGKMRTILEAELVLHEGENWQPIRLHTLLVTVDTRTRQMLEIRFPSKEEEERRAEESAEAT